MSVSGPQLVSRSEPTATRIYGVVLSVGVVCALAIATVFEVTRPIIQRQRTALRERAVLDVLPDAQTSVAFRFNLTTGKFEVLKDVAELSAVVFAGFDDQGQCVGLAIESRGMGYQDVIRLVYGYSFSAQAIIGIRILESRETPGLGDRIEQDASFLQNFESLDVALNEQGDDLANSIAFVKPGKKSEAWQIDGISGATISSRTVAEILSHSAAQWIPRVNARLTDFVNTAGEGS